MLSLVAIVLAVDGGVSPALEVPATYQPVVYLAADLAAAIPVAADALLGSQTRAKACLDQLKSYRVHVSRDGSSITVVLLPTNRCGEGLKGGGGVVTLDALSLRVLSKRGFE